MGNASLRRRLPAFAAGLASLVMASGIAAIPAEAASPKVDYVALGDSYTAGTGAGPFDFGYPCDRTPGGYVDVVGKTGRVNLVMNAACHGAVLSATNPFYDHSIPIPTVAEQIQNLPSGTLSADTELVSITAGANDLGFSYVLGQCAYYGSVACSDALAGVASPSVLAKLSSNLAWTYKEIQQAAPNATIAVMGYPLLFDPTSQYAPLPVESQMLMNQATLLVNSTIAGAVSTANTVYSTKAKYVDVTGSFAGHAVNSLEPWINLDPVNFTDPRNFHPNKEGHRAYASALLEAVKPSQLVTR
ncbi:lysophospholipase L1-like esterase [Arthrobacter sp. B2I5]|uniref:SGNH/GDSL hydrolase family protein n=1 Tax=Arthrobacter sp. B2I5 TaxID=3042266 RepID=UPI0027847E82|nr:SGNH/GDSL hydrolase family protein [Arthrobacter sp. B2I5]MDQ0824414.1 lysophospholipase L1-like esterase [Arthrobacter sp. B2I5]